MRTPGWAWICRAISCLSTGRIRGRAHGRRSGHLLRLARQAALAEEMACVENGDHGLFPRVRQDRQTHDALLDIDDARGRIALSKDRCSGSALDALCSHGGAIEYVGGPERLGSRRLTHRTFLPPHTFAALQSPREERGAGTLPAGTAVQRESDADGADAAGLLPPLSPSEP